MCFFYIGDVVGSVGVCVIEECIFVVCEEYGIDVVMVNVENVELGFGIIKNIFCWLIKLGVDCVMLGDYIYCKCEIIEIFELDY